MTYTDVHTYPCAAPIADAGDVFPPTHYHRQPLLDTKPEDIDPDRSLGLTQSRGACSEALWNAANESDATVTTRPIHRLPPELLTEIFLHCLTQFNRPHPSEAPLLLTQICSWWRCVCISIPQIWSSLEFAYKVCETTPVMHDFKGNTDVLVDLWLSRSGDRPLSLSIQGDAILFKHIRCLLNSDTITRRLQHLKLVIPRRTYSAFLPETRCPRLTTVELNTPDGLVETLLQETSTVFSQSAELRGFIWANKGFTPSIITVQWSSLSNLHLSIDISIQNCLEVLEASINAVTVHIKKIRWDLIQSPSREIVLPCLTSLVLSSRVNITQIFECLTVPNLKGLVINVTAWPHAVMMNFAARSKFRLENLDIFYPPITDVEMLDMLDMVHSSLTELTLQTSSPTVTDYFLQKLSFEPFVPPSSASPSRPEPFCPRLESIALYGCTACSPGAVARMVESRQQHPSSSTVMVVPLKIVETHHSEPELDSLISLRSLGVQVVVYEDELEDE